MGPDVPFSTDPTGIASRSDEPGPASRAPLHLIETDAAAIEQAIQAGCGTLLALEASLATVEAVSAAHGGGSTAEASLREARELVRTAVADLRAAAGTPSSGAIEFVTRRGR